MEQRSPNGAELQLGGSLRAGPACDGSQGRGRGDEDSEKKGVNPVGQERRVGPFVSCDAYVREANEQRIGWTSEGEPFYVEKTASLSPPEQAVLAGDFTKVCPSLSALF